LQQQAFPFDAAEYIPRNLVNAVAMATTDLCRVWRCVRTDWRNETHLHRLAFVHNAEDFA
jgi:hypothetical protein